MKTPQQRQPIDCKETVCTELCQYLLLQPCSFPCFSNSGLLTYLCKCPSLIMYKISCHTRSLAHRKRNSQLCQNFWQFCDVKKKSTLDTFHLQLKITDFDLRSLEEKGLHRLPANQAPKCSTCMELEHNKCFLWAGPVALAFLTSSDLLQGLAFWAFGGWWG